MLSQNDKPLIWSCLLLFLTACTSSDTTEQTNTDTSSRPNILWIVADDLGTDLGCYGEEAVFTPNMDRLAAQGVRYSNFFTVTAVCSPSRSGLITGMYPTSINCHQHRTQYKNPLPENVQPLPELFREAGYYVSNASARDFSKFGKTDYNFIHDSEKLYDSPDWNDRAEGQPFFAQVQIFYPHRPFVADTMHPVDSADVTIPPYYPDHPVTRKDWALYLETVQQADQEVGKVLEKLEADGLLDSTIIFFFGDQGRPHVRAKQFLYDGGIRTPLLIRFPNQADGGSVNDRLVSNIDVAAATLHLAGIPIPDWMQGQNFLGESPERTSIFAMRDRRDETVDRIRAVRSKRFKYIRNFYPERPWTQFNAYKKQAYPVLTLMEIMHKNGELPPEQARFMQPSRPKEELYDLQNDPYELNNLAENATYSDTLLQMRTVLDDWLARADKGTYPEDPKEIEYAEQLMKDRFRQHMERRGLPADVSDEALLAWWKKEMGLEE